MSKKVVRINQNISYLSDEFSFTSPTLDDFLNEKEEYEVSHGYGGKEITLYGIADQWTIRKTKHSFELNVVCRDKMKDALQTYFQKTYFYSPPASALRTQFVASPSTQGGGGGSPTPASIHAVSDYDLPAEYGQFMASDVAQDACETAGLSCIWDCTDYPVVTPFKRTNGFSGTVADVLKKLIEPLQKTEMFKIDIYILDDTVIIRKRRFPYIAEHTIDVSDVRIREFSLTKINYNPERPDESPDETPVKDIYIVQEDWDEEETEDDTGEDNEDEQDQGEEGGGGGSWTGSTKTVGPEIFETLDPVTNEVITREIKTTYLINEIVIRETNQVFKRFADNAGPLVLTDDSVTVYSYYGLNPSADYQKLMNKVTTSRMFDENKQTSEIGDAYLSKIITATTTYTYNASDELIIEDTLKQTVSYDYQGSKIKASDGTDLITYSQDTTTYTQINKDWIKVRKVSYLNGVLVDKSEDTVSGQMPGPKKVAKNENSTLDDDRLTEHFQEKYEVSEEDDSEEDQEKREKGQDAEIREELLSEDQLRELAQEVKTEQRSRKYELSMAVLPMPWLLKGTVFSVTGLTISDGLGNEFDVSTLSFLITYLDYELTKGTYLSTIRAIAYVTQ